MYAVIFKAEILELDSEYTEMAEKMRHLAMSQYACTEFTSCAEGEYEISISYWPNLDQIKKWKQNIDHLDAQNKGRSKWYKSYKIEITKIERSYGTMF